MAGCLGDLDARLGVALGDEVVNLHISSTVRRSIISAMPVATYRGRLVADPFRQSLYVVFDMLNQALLRSRGPLKGVILFPRRGTLCFLDAFRCARQATIWLVQLDQLADDGRKRLLEVPTVVQLDYIGFAEV